MEAKDENVNKLVDYMDSFMFRNHFCIVFELLGSNLYSDIKERAAKGDTQEVDMENLKWTIYQIL